MSHLGLRAQDEHTIGPLRGVGTESPGEGPPGRFSSRSTLGDDRDDPTELRSVRPPNSTGFMGHGAGGEDREKIKSRVRLPTPSEQAEVVSITVGPSGIYLSR